jgi:hypothetical protein
VLFVLTDALDQQSFSNNRFVLQLFSNHLKYCRVDLKSLTARSRIGAVKGSTLHPFLSAPLNIRFLVKKAPAKRRACVLSLPPPLCARSNHLLDDADCFSPLPITQPLLTKVNIALLTVHIFPFVYILEAKVLRRGLAGFA